MKPEAVPGLPGCYLVRNFLSREECSRLISRGRQLGYRKPDPVYPPSYRNNERLVVDDKDLAATLYQGLNSALAPLTDEQGHNWLPIGINERIRFCRYLPGQFFGIHQDGVHHRTSRVQSRMTFMVYLNDSAEFSGGATRFFANRSPDSQTVVQIAPECGTLILFDHSLWHDGEPVTSGEKYILRSDILYECSDVTLSDEHSGYVWSVIELDDGRLATGGRDTTVRIWNRTPEGVQLDQVLNGHGCSVSALLTPSRVHLWTGSRDGQLIQWRNEHGKWCLERAQTVCGGAILSLSRAGDAIACGSADGGIRLFSSAGNAIGSLQGSGWAWALSETKSGELISAHEDGYLRLWDLNKKQLIDSVLAGPPLKSLAVSGSQIAAGGEDGQIFTWQTKGGRIRTLRRWQAHAGAVRSVAFQSDGTLWSGGEDDLGLSWSVETSSRQSVRPHDGFVTCVRPLIDGAIASTSYDGHLRIAGAK